MLLHILYSLVNIYINIMKYLILYMSRLKIFLIIDIKPISKLYNLGNSIWHFALEKKILKKRPAKCYHLHYIYGISYK